MTTEEKLDRLVTAYVELVQKVDKVDLVLKKLTDLATTVGAINTQVKEVPTLAGQIQAMNRVVDDGRNQIAVSLAELRKPKPKGPPPKPDPECWIIRAELVATEEDEEAFDEDTHEDKFFAGLVPIGEGKAVWTTDWQDAYQYENDDRARDAARNIYTERRRPKNDNPDLLWKLYIQPVYRRTIGLKDQYISRVRQDWTPVPHPGFAPARS